MNLAFITECHFSCIRAARTQRQSREQTDPCRAQIPDSPLRLPGIHFLVSKKKVLKFPFLPQPLRDILFSCFTVKQIFLVINAKIPSAHWHIFSSSQCRHPKLQTGLRKSIESTATINDTESWLGIKFCCQSF